MKKGWKNFWITCGVVAGIGCVCLISGKVMGATLTVMDNYIPDWIGLGRGEVGVSYDYGDAPMEADTDKTYGDIHALKLDTEGLNVQILKGTGSGITVQTEDIYSALKFQVTEEDGELKVETTARRFPWRIKPKDIRHKIVRFIETRCLRPAGEKLVCIKMERLSDEIGESRLNVSRELNAMNAEGAISLRRGEIKVFALEKLIM